MPLRTAYPTGTWVEFVWMANAQGMVDSVDDSRCLLIGWDDGRRLNVVEGVREEWRVKGDDRDHRGPDRGNPQHQPDERVLLADGTATGL